MGLRSMSAIFTNVGFTDYYFIYGRYAEKKFARDGIQIKLQHHVERVEDVRATRLKSNAWLADAGRNRVFFTLRSKAKVRPAIACV